MEEKIKLMTKELKKKFKKFPLYSQSGKGKDAEVVVKYFTPWGKATWLITEGEELPDGDWEFYGYGIIHEWEWGYVRLSQLKSIRHPLFGLGVERDLYLEEGTTVKELVEE